MRRLIFALLCGLTVQSADAQKNSWQHLDLKSDGIFGVSTDKAYTELLKGRKGKMVIVAVIDGGVDTNHVDLEGVLGDRGKFGWSFLGSAKGNVNREALELSRLVRAGQKRFPNPNQATGDTSGLSDYLKVRAAYHKKLQQLKSGLQSMGTLKLVSDTIFAKIGKDLPGVQDLRLYQAETLFQANIKSTILNQLIRDPAMTLESFRRGLNETVQHLQDEEQYSLNLNFDPRELVGDQVDDLKQMNYGSMDVMGPDAKHGSHVSGIIGAVRNNGIGIDGVADKVRILNIRAIPNGDERDKDVANAIIYAVDQGAKVINMSFGKAYSPNKSRVDEAVKYAMSKDVLLVHAAGNEGLDLDEEGNYFPNKFYLDGSGSAAAWLNVGASGPKDNESLAASFSNFGKTSVDVFAPGVGIYSTIPESGYQNLDGTSMAAPVVTGIAALIRSYYPKLNAVQIKEIIMSSTVKVEHKVKVIKNGRKVNIPFNEICVSGGIVNAYQALKLAESY